MDILKSVKLSLLQTQSFAPRDVVDVLKYQPEKDLLATVEVSYTAWSQLDAIHVL